MKKRIDNFLFKTLQPKIEIYKLNFSRLGLTELAFRNSNLEKNLQIQIPLDNFFFKCINIELQNFF